MQELWEKIRAHDIEYLRANLTSELIASSLKTEERITIEHSWKDKYDDVTQWKYPLHEAIRCKFIEGIELILERGGSLSQSERTLTECTREVGCFNTMDYQTNETSTTAIDLIEQSNDANLIQFIFNRISQTDLHKQPRYKAFLYAHLKHVDLENFDPQILGFSSAHKLPRGFNTREEFKQHLLEKDVNVNGIDFSEPPPTPQTPAARSPRKVRQTEISSFFNPREALKRSRDGQEPDTPGNNKQRKQSTTL